jgi:hydrogenase small subunit
VPGAWPIGIGHPCIGCTEQNVVFNVPIHTNLPIEQPTAPMAYPAVNPNHGVLGSASGALAVGVGGAVIGALAGAGFVASKKLTAEADQEAKDLGKKE